MEYFSMIELDANGNWVEVDDAKPTGQAPAGIPARVGRDYPETSKQAAAKANTQARMTQVYKVIESFGDRGCISDQVLDALPDVPYQSITSQWGNMIDLGMIERTGETRTGSRNNRQQMVMVALAEPWIPKNKHKKERAEDTRIRRARYVAERMRNATALMCAEDRVRFKFLIGQLDRVLK
jgi:hypothetical protein